ncbi:hypothetical protein D7Y13_04430 [Corallococcus praedator]|uniref:Uncharacterized protein n=1 Tax=Corallococcus praedator TaxID=2316724 RepID=A0ABX9QPC2_9BACT|nr:hypothetical protein D7Y13_04430 [Corallococcus praedator]
MASGSWVAVSRSEDLENLESGFWGPFGALGEEGLESGFWGALGELGEESLESGFWGALGELGEESLESGFWGALGEFGLEDGMSCAGGRRMALVEEPRAEETFMGELVSEEEGGCRVQR